MKPILVHVHIYYIDIWEELKVYLKNIEYNLDLYVTIVGDHIDLQKDIMSFRPDAKIHIVENRGFDIGPFVHVINDVNLNNYSYIVKLHTKRTVNGSVVLNGFRLIGNRWRECLLSFIDSKDNFNKALSVLEDKKIGMISDYKIVCSQRGSDRIAEKRFCDFLKKYRFPQKSFCFVAGSMFIAKAEIFVPLQKILTLDDFEKELKSSGQLAHVVERFLGYLVYYNNQKIFLSNIHYLCILLKKFTLFLYQNKITKSNKRLVKICKVPVFYKKIK